MSDRSDVSKRASWTMVLSARLMAPLMLIAAAGCAAEDQDASAIEPVTTVRSAVTTGFTKINAGSTTGVGTFIADDDFSGGTTTSTTHTITIPADAVGAAPANVYKTVRWATSTSSPFTYTLPGFAAGSLNMIRLHFAEAFVTAGQRVFNVTINGATVLANFDIFIAAAGADRAVIKEFTLPAGSDGKYVIQFSSVVGRAIVSGIEAVASTMAQATSIHAGGAAFGPFAADVGFSGGTVVTNTHTVATGGIVHSSAPTLYQTARTTTTSGTSFTYSVPGFPAGGINTVRLHFAETRWTAAGQRVFHVSINGTRVLDSFDIFAAAGGADRAIVRELRAAADSSGRYVIRFDKVTDAPLVSGIEVVRSVPWFVRTDMTASEYQAEFSARAAAGYRLTYVNGYAVSGTTRFVAIWDLTPGPAFQAAHNMPKTDFEAQNAAKAAAGLTLALVNGYDIGGTDFYAAIWIARPSPPPIITKVGLDDATYLAEFQTQGSNGYRMVHVSGYTVNGQARYAATWEQRTGPGWYSLHSLNDANLVLQIKAAQDSGFRLIDLSGYNVGGIDRYDVIFEASAGPATVEAHGLGSGEHRLRLDDLHRQGYAPSVVTAFPGSGGGQSFASLWQNVAYSATDLGTIDAFVNTAMTGYDAGAGANRALTSLSLAVAKDGRLVFAKAYRGATATEDVHVSSLYRIASNSKTITSAAINRLIDQGKLHQDSKVFGPDLLGERYGTAPYAPGMYGLTIRQLLSHSSGLPDVDVYTQGRTPAQVMASVVNGSIGTPGTYQYLNINYYILGRVIDRLAGGPNWTINDPRNYESWVTQNVLLPSGISDMSIGANTLAGRKANEVTYSPNVAYVDTNVSGMDANGGWIATPIDLVRFMTHIDNAPTVPDIVGPATESRMYTKQSNANYGFGWLLNFDGAGNLQEVLHEGSFHGTFCVIRRLINGMQFAAVTNWHPDGFVDPLWQLSQDIAYSSVAWTPADVLDQPN
jgi:CubicO group peptidase (beta-lactamase class C family)